METVLYILIFIFLINNPFYAVDHTCKKVGNEKWLSGIQGQKNYLKYQKICIRDQNILVRYIRCYIDCAVLDVKRLKELFPNLKTIFWQCKGYNVISNPIIGFEVHGCSQGKYISIPLF